MKEMTDPCDEVVAAEMAACTIAKNNCTGRAAEAWVSFAIMVILGLLVICCCCGGCCFCYKKKKLCFKPKASKVVAATQS